MDDIRRPQHLKRRDYAIPERHQQPDQLQTPHAPHHRVHQPQPQPSHTPHTYHHPQPTVSLQHHAHPQPAATQVPARTKSSRFNGKALSVTAAAFLALAAVFGAGYLLRGSADSKGIPASITRQVNYALYFPSPMPNGYTYMKNTATFQIGQVYYKFSNGRKRVTVVEQPLADPKPNLNLLQGYEQFDVPVGKAAVGLNLGETQAVVVTPTTVITMNSVGGVSPDDLRTAINNLKNIGQSNQKT